MKVETFTVDYAKRVMLLMCQSIGWLITIFARHNSLLQTYTILHAPQAVCMCFPNMCFPCQSIWPAPRPLPRHSSNAVRWRCPASQHRCTNNASSATLYPNHLTYKPEFQFEPTAGTTTSVCNAQVPQISPSFPPTPLPVCWAWLLVPLLPSGPLDVWQLSRQRGAHPHSQ